VWAGATGCTSGQGGSAAEPKPYVRPAGWATECVGRYQFDAPGPIRVGQMLPEWEPGGKMRYRLEPAAGKFGGGSVDISGLRMFESEPFAPDRSFGYVDRRADAYFEIRVIRDGGPEEAEAERARTTQRYALRWPTSFVWRSDKHLDFGVLMPEDRRARMIHGYPADKSQFPNNISGDKARDMFESLWSRFKVRAPGEIPSQPGFCTPFGFFVDPPGVTEKSQTVAVTFLPPGYENLIAGVTVGTLEHRAYEPTPDETPIEQRETPWATEERRAREEKANCKQNPATTASRDAFGCMFAGARDIKSHREVEFITLGDGRKARVVVMELYSSINGSITYTVEIETGAKLGSATEPEVLIWASGVSGDAKPPAFNGKKPPAIDDAVALVKTIARSARLRPGAVEPGAAVRDTLAAYR
jgi:hypothetical protein